MRQTVDTVQEEYEHAESDQEITKEGTVSIAKQEATRVGGNLDNLPVQLEICLAEIGLSLSRFRTLTAGVTVPLDIDLTAKLDITVNGVKFGHGTLVQIGEKIGIQIEKWHTELEH